QPQPTFRPVVPPTIERLVDLPQGCVTGLNDHDTDSLWFQTLFEKPITSGYVARVPERKYFHGWHIHGLGVEGRFAEMMRVSGATYLLRDVRRMPEMVDTGFKQLAADD